MKTLGRVLLAAGLVTSVMAQSEEVLRSKKLAQAQAEADLQKLKANVVMNGQTYQFVSGQLISGNPVKGAPYSAESVNESVQTLADGNRIVQRTSAMQYRDSDGRERREETSAMGAVFITDPVAGTRYTLHPETRSFEKGSMQIIQPVKPILQTPVFSDNPVTLKGTATQVEWMNPTVWIALNVQGADGAATAWRCATSSPNSLLGSGWTRDTLKNGDALTINGVRASDSSNTCKATSVTLADGKTMSVNAPTAGPVTVAAGGRSGGGRGVVGQVLTGPPDGPFALAFGLNSVGGQTKTESLGNMYLEGVQAQGTRTTTTIPAGDIGNDRPINIVDERWYSPDLQMTVMTKHLDPRSGETTFQLKSINRSSPPPTLFEVPSDYTPAAPGGRSGGRGVITLQPFGTVDRK